MENKIVVKNLQHKFNIDTDREKIALKGLNIEISKGEFVAILGSNGSGKSTLAKHFNGIYLPSGGKVYVEGMDTEAEESLWEIRRRVGMVFQNPENQLVATQVEEDVAFGPENLGFPSKEIRRRVDEALKVVNMEEYRKHPPHLLSGGQKQRVAIAGVLAMEPSYLVFDEPTAMLDPAGRKEVLDTLVHLNKNKNIAVVLITHFVEEAVEADRVLVMENGLIAMDGTPKGVFQEVEKLKRMGLTIPRMTEIAYLLNQEGINVPVGTLTMDEMVRHLCQLK